MLYFSRLPLVLSRIVSTSFVVKLIEAVVIFETFNAPLVINKVTSKNIFCQKRPLQIGTTRQLYNFNLNQQNFDKEKLSRSCVLIKWRDDLKPPKTTYKLAETTYTKNKLSSDCVCFNPHFRGKIRCKAVSIFQA